MVVLTQAMNGTETDETDSVILEIIIPSAVSLSSHLGAFPQAADDQQGQNRESKDAGDDRNDNRFWGDCKEPTIRIFRIYCDTQEWTH